MPTTANQFQISASFGGTVKVAESALNDGQILYLTNSPTTAVPVNQQIALQGATFDGATWQDLGSMTVSGNSGTIRVQLSNTGSGNLAADAVQVVQNVLPNLQYVNLSGNHLNNAAYNYVLPGLTAQRPGGFPAIASNPADPAVAGLVYDSDPNAPTFTQTIATQSATAGSTTTVTLANIVNGVATNGVATDLDGDTITYGASSNNSQVAATVATVNGNILLQDHAPGRNDGGIRHDHPDGRRPGQRSGRAEGRTAQQSFVVLVGTGEITGSVYSDNNGNGVKDPGEGIAGYSVYEDLNNSGAYVTGDPVTVTDSNGNYAFYGVDLGKPTVVREDTTSPAWSAASLTSQSVLYGVQNVAPQLSTTGNYASPNSLSANGQYVVFTSSDSLLPADTNGTDDVYLRNLQTGVLTLISVNTAGVVGNNESFDPVISADGTLVAFESTATNLDPRATDGNTDVYVRNLLTNTTTLVSVSNAGAGGNNVSRFPAFGDNDNMVVFESDATNLDPRATSGINDIYVRNLATNTTTFVSVSDTNTDGNGYYCEYPVISANAAVVAFDSDSSNLDPRDTTSNDNVFVRNLTTNTTTLVSLNTAGTVGNNDSYEPVISANGTVIVFSSVASNLDPRDTTSSYYNVFARNLTTNTTTLVSLNTAGTVGNNYSYDPVISADGTLVVFDSEATNLDSRATDGNLDLYVRNLNSNTTTLVSVGSANIGGNSYSVDPVISASDEVVAFYSYATNLDPRATDGNDDVYARNLATNTTTLVSLSTTGTGGNDYSDNPSISSDGTIVVFESEASNLAAKDLNNNSNVFVADLPDLAIGNSPVYGNVNFVTYDEVNAGGDQSVSAGTPVSLTAKLGSGLTNPTYSWTVTENGQPYLLSGTVTNQAMLQFTPYEGDNSALGIKYTATVTVTGILNGSPATFSDSVGVYVKDVAPTTNPGPDFTANEGDPVTLFSNVTDPDIEDTFNYTWQATCNGQLVADGHDADFTFTPTDMGSYAVTLSVSDRYGGVAAVKTVNVTVLNVPPTVTIQGAPASSPEAAPISLSSTIVAPGVLDHATWHVDASNGQAIADFADYGFTTNANGTYTSDFSFTPSIAGTYLVTLTAFDKNGGSTALQQVVTVTDVAPTAAIVALPRTSPRARWLVFSVLLPIRDSPVAKPCRTTNGRCPATVSPTFCPGAR